MIRAYHQPKCIDEALSLLKNGAQAVAGATGLYSNRKRVDGELVDITGLGLNGIEVKGGAIRLGACVTLTQLLEADLPGAEGAFLKLVARHITAHTMRNAITLGGNIAHTAFWADMPVALLALDAQIIIAKAGEAEKTVAIAEALQEASPWKGGLIKEIIVPVIPGRTFGYERLSKTKNDYAFVTAASSMIVQDGKANSVRVVLGAIQPRAFRAAAVEEMLEGKVIDEALLAAVAQAARELPVMPNFRASADYRRDVTSALVRRAVAQAAGQE